MQSTRLGWHVHGRVVKRVVKGESGQAFTIGNLGNHHKAQVPRQGLKEDVLSKSKKRTRKKGKQETNNGRKRTGCPIKYTKKPRIASKTQGFPSFEWQEKTYHPSEYLSLISAGIDQRFPPVWCCHVSQLVLRSLPPFFSDCAPVRFSSLS
ncbi:hypothetical protein BU24DRAFT_133900 [Aaosphaeria arxii CBS 175.79]|uniref:Uncharacterized protein n=1 Tax=Aaosphaeria arxii CBS 175.79 TaxID=1450172 RepID=A0A6A5Y3L1_9PLEO|nr:uncharacterized protein BU24DRAFT_133900 [Aaosphaeria arxii CBS 175.79]KAF2020135.1 hypothetical protein BU24DRAFT_133900 [Aaosphaeria arxii CBS 175.79]